MFFSNLYCKFQGEGKFKNDALPHIPNGAVTVFSIAKELGVELLDPKNCHLVSENGKVSKVIAIVSRIL